MEQPTASRELPRYRSHKEVWALKIRSVERLGEDGAMITPEDTRYAPFRVGCDYVRRHSPEWGGYYVRYKDGYESFSPAAAFEEGYSKIS